jgi:MscS family membrane protein
MPSFPNLLLQTLPDVSFWQRLSVARVLYAILMLLGAWSLVRLSSAFLDALSQRVPRSRFFFKMLATLLRFGLWMVGALLMIAVFAPSRETMLAVIASVGIALGLGAQDLVKNLIGGLIILTDRPYQLGDRVKIGDAYGEIDHIGLRSTKLTTPDDTRVTIPNSDILTGQAWNANSGVPDCQVVTDLFLPIDTDPTVATEIGYEAAFSSPFILLAKPVVVLVQDGFEQTPFLRLRVKAYVYDHRFEPRLQSDITQRAKAEFIRRALFAPWQKPKTADLKSD